MLEQQLYVREKMVEFEAIYRPAVLPADRAPRGTRRARGPLRPIARAAGRQVRRVGEALESWATPQAAAR